MFQAPGIVVDPYRKKEIPKNFYIRTARNRWIYVMTPRGLTNYDSSSGPLQMICLNELQEGVIDSTPAVLVEMLGPSVSGKHYARIIEPGMTRIVWEEHVDLFVNGATDTTVVNNEAVELPEWTGWCLQ